MRRTVWLYGLMLALLVLFMKVVEFRYLVRDLPLGFFLTIVAVLCSGLGIWMGLRITRKKEIAYREPFVVDEDRIKQLGISKREREVLELMAQGLTNYEIADKLHVSLNTVKTHSSNLFLKLEVSRRTQAVKKARELHLIP